MQKKKGILLEDDHRPFQSPSPHLTSPAKGAPTLPPTSVRTAMRVPAPAGLRGSWSGCSVLRAVCVCQPRVRASKGAH